MKIKIMVKRRRSPGEAQYEQSFVYDGDGRLSVANWIREINRTDVADDEIAWECGCLEMKCGACAMLINGYPTLACSLTLNDAAKRGEILIEPLSKFPVVKDLVVERKLIFDTLKEMKIWLKEKEKTTLPRIEKLSIKLRSACNAVAVLRFAQALLSAENLSVPLQC